jgi:hypothetical protein
MVYELMGIADSDDPELQPGPNSVELIEMTLMASMMFEAGDRQGAANAYQGILNLHAGDPVASAMLGRPELAPYRGQKC